MMTPPLVIFDCDGVLVDSEPLAAQVLADALTVLGLGYDSAAVDERFRGRSLADITREIEAELSEPLPLDFLPALNEHTYAAFRDHLRPVVGIEETLTTLTTAGVPICVASSGNHDKIRFSLGLTDLLPFFGSSIFSAADVEHGKPAPDLFLHAARNMGVPIGRAVVIEDSVPGIAAGVSSGARVLAYVAPSLRRRSDHEDAVRRMGAEPFSTMGSLPALLGLR